MYSRVRLLQKLDRNFRTEIWRRQRKGSDITDITSVRVCSLLFVRLFDILINSATFKVLFY